jgi:hypothetical protein
MSGLVLNFTEADLKATADAYDPALYEAPLVVGHPKLNAPAYGWVKSLAFSGALDAEPDQVDPAFAEMVNKGHFKKVSASFFLPNAPENPKPGVYYLRHVGFLGAQPPAVRGLKNASFAGGEEGVIEFGDWAEVWQARLLRRLRDWLIGKFGSDEADKAIDPYAIEELERLANEPQKPTTGVSYSEHNQEITMKPDEIVAKEADVKKREDAITTKEASFAAREQRIAAVEDKARRTEVTAYVEGLVKEGKLLPREQAPLVEFMAALDEAAVIEFAEGGETKKEPRGKWLREFLGRLPKQVDYAEHTKPGEGGDNTVSFAAPHGYGVDPARLELHNKALTWQRQHPDTAYDTAIRAVSN